MSLPVVALATTELFLVAINFCPICSLKNVLGGRTLKDFLGWRTSAAGMISKQQQNTISKMMTVERRLYIYKEEALAPAPNHLKNAFSFPAHFWQVG